MVQEELFNKLLVLQKEVLENSRGTKQGKARMFFDSVCDMISPLVLSNQKAFNNYRKNRDKEVLYWLSCQKWSLKETLNAIVFNTFCVIDGVDNISNFNPIKLDVQIPDLEEYHANWAKYNLQQSF